MLVVAETGIAIEIEALPMSAALAHHHSFENRASPDELGIGDSAVLSATRDLGDETVVQLMPGSSNDVGHGRRDVTQVVLMPQPNVLIMEFLQGLIASSNDDQITSF